jgi:glucose 1-dehydrogenase
MPTTASCLITGGLGDIGRATAAALRAADPGLAIHLCDLRPSEGPLGSGFTAHRLDVADADAVAACIADIPDLRLAVVNAAVVSLGSLRDLDLAVWKREIDVNLNGAAYTAICAARAIAANGGGRIVLTGSWAADRPHPHIPAYCVAKAGLRMLTRLLAVEFAADQVVVNELAPGLVDAGLSAQVWRERPDLRAVAVQIVPSGRLITADEVGAEIAHLLLRSSPHITGSTITMTGGIDLKVP